MKTLIALLALLATIAVAGDKAEPKELTAAREAYIAALQAISDTKKDMVEKAAIDKEISAVRQLVPVIDDSEATRVAALLPGTWKGVYVGWSNTSEKIQDLVAFKKDGTWESVRENSLVSGNGTWKVAGTKLVFRYSNADIEGAVDLKKVGRTFTLEFPALTIKNGRFAHKSFVLTKKKDE